MGAGEHVSVDPAVEAALEGELPGNLPPDEEELPPPEPEAPPRVVRNQGGAGRGRKAGQPAQPAQAAPAPGGPFPRYPHIRFGQPPGTFYGVGTTIPGSEAMSVWGAIVEELVGIGSDPAYVAIEVGRTVRGPQSMERINCGMDIDGASVAGGENLSAGQALQEYVVNVFHSGMVHPAKYDFRVYWKRSPAQAIRRNLYLMLDPYDLILQRRQRSEMYLRNQRGQSAPMSEPMPPLGMGAQGGVRYAVPPPPPPQQQPWGAYGSPPAPPMGSGGVDPAIDAIRRDLSAVIARASGQDSVRAELQALVARLQPAPPPTAVPGGLTKEDVARTVVEVLKVMGVGTAAASSAVVTPPQQVAVLTKDPLDAVLDDLERGKKREQRVRELFGIEDTEPAPAPAVAAAVVEPEKPPFGVVTVPLANFAGKPVQWPTDVEGGTLEWAKAFLACNPDIGIEGFKIAANIIDKGVIGQAIAMMQRGTPQQQQVAQQAVRDGLNGATPPPVEPPPQEPWSPTP